MRIYTMGDLVEFRKLCKPSFHPELPPFVKKNVEAALSRGLTYDKNSDVYRNCDGIAVRDARGYPIGRAIEILKEGNYEM